MVTKTTKLLTNTTIIFFTMLAGCGGGGDSPTATAATVPAVDPATTSAIQSNIDMNYISEQTLLKNGTEACQRQLSAAGQGLSTNIKLCAVTEKEIQVPNFLATILANIRTVKNSTPIDKTAIANIISSYQTRDLAWLTAPCQVPYYTISCLDSIYALNAGELNNILATYNDSINTPYSNALFQLNAM